MTTMYFASNQKKQKAFDRYYNAKAKSDFKQGVKLKALINQEAADAALAEQLASMYLNAVGKTREYDYDTVNDKLGRKAPPLQQQASPVVEEASPVAEPQQNNKSKQKRKYVHQTTDPDVDVDDRAMPESDFVKKMVNDEIRKKYAENPKSTNFKSVDQRINDYLKGQKMKRREKTQAKRDIKAQFEKQFATADISAKRSRAESTTSPNQREKKKPASEEAIRKTLNFDDEGDDEDEEFKVGVKEEELQREVNKSTKREYTKFIDNYSTYSCKNLYKDVKHRFKEKVDKQMGDGYFDDFIKEPMGFSSKKRMAAYKTELKGILDGMFST